MKVAVTGASGFIGSHVVDRLVAAGHQVRVLDPRAPHRRDVEWTPCDVTRLSQVADSLKGIDAVFHLAAMANVNDVAAAPAESIEVNVLGTGLVLEAARLSNVGHFLLASTVWVYEASDAMEVDESTPLRPDGVKHLYTAEKIAAEMIAHAYSTLFGVGVTVLRYGIPYGPRMREQLVIPIFIRRALDGQPLTVAGDGLQYRNFVYVEDLAEAHVTALEKKATGTFNVEGPRPVAIIEVAEAVHRRVPGSVGIVRTEARAGDYQGRSVSAKRAREVLGWTPCTSFEDGFEATVDWFLRQWKPAE